MNAEVRAQLGDEVSAALEALGFRFDRGHPVAVEHVVPVTACPIPHSPIAAFRVTLGNGDNIKVRRVRSEELADRAKTWLARLNSACFAKVLASTALVWVEEWVEGEPLTEPSLISRNVTAAGERLGELHARCVEEVVVHGEEAPDSVVERLRADLELLTERKFIDEALARTLSERALAHRPTIAATGLTHNDYCGANLILTSGGELRIIDNDALDVGFLDWDVARTRSRWPMPRADWEHFLDGYRRSSGRAPTAPDWAFFRIATQVRTAAFFGKHSPASAPARLQPLVGLAAGRDDWFGEMDGPSSTGANAPTGGPLAD